MSIERDFATWVRAKCWRLYKIRGEAQMGAPDRLLVLPGGVNLWIEFKQPGEPVRDRQIQEHDDLSRMGHVVVVVRTPEDLEHVREYARGVEDGSFPTVHRNRLLRKLNT